MAKKGKNIIIGLECSECKERNYVTFKNREKHSDKLALNKYCPRCRHHTGHKECKAA